MFNIGKRGLTSIPGVFRAIRILPRLSPAGPPSYNFVEVLKKIKIHDQSRLIHFSRNLKDQSTTHDIQKEPQQRQNVTKFQELEDLKMVHPNIIRCITEKLGHHTLTDVQVATINEGLQGVDIIAQARTGTGKTFGFLIPTIQNILRRSPELANRQRSARARPSDIRAIIVSPTRELAEQIAVEAEKLCYDTDVVVQVAVGGNSKRQMLLKTQRQGCHLLVGTPGRLQDLLSDPYSGVKAPKLTTFVLDEADRLLDDGFSNDIEEITKLLPDRQIVDRQTLLFSATVPREVMHLVRKTLKPNFHFVKTVKDGDLATHEKVPQNVIVTTGIENWLPCLLELAKKSIAAEKNASDAPEEDKPKPFKAIVYFSSTAQVELAYDIIKRLRTEHSETKFPGNPLRPAELYLIHGSMSQEGRTRAATRYRGCRTGILFSTDVTARGMDFPGVSHVFQMGLPPNQEQYIHRVGRTGRGDKTGDGYLIIDRASINEAKRMLRGLPIFENKDVLAAKVDLAKDDELPDNVAQNFSEVAAATKLCSLRTKEAAYKAGLSSAKSSEQTLSLARWTKFGWGLEKPPPIGSSLASKLGIARFPGINIGPPTVYDDEPAESYNSGMGRGRGYGLRSVSGYGNRSTGGYGDRSTGGYGNRSTGGYGDRSTGGYGDRSTGGYGDRSTGGYGDRSTGGYGDRSTGGYGDRSTSGYGDRSTGGYGDRSKGGYGDRSRGGYGSGRIGNSYGEKSDLSDSDDRESGNTFRNRENTGGFGNRESRGGFSNRESRGGFSNREGRGGFNSRGGGSGFGNRESRGGFSNREGRGGFNSRGGGGGFGSRESRGGSNSRGGRGGFSSRGGRGGFGN